VVANKDIIWISDPEASRGLIGVEQTPRAANVKYQVVFDIVLGLDGVFDENCVAHSTVGYIVLNAQVVNAVNSDGSVVGVMDCIISNVRRLDCSNHMEMDRVGAQNESLTNIEQFNVVDSCSGRLVGGRMHNNNSTILICFRGHRLALIFDIASQKTNLSSHFNKITWSTITVILNSSVVLEKKWLIESNHWVSTCISDTCNLALLGVASRVVGGSDYDLFSNFPIKGLATSHIIECNRGSACFGSCLEISPGNGTLNTVHLESTIVYADTFVAEDWNSGAVF